jgi:hypothetical protein
MEIIKPASAFLERCRNNVNKEFLTNTDTQ